MAKNKRVIMVIDMLNGFCKEGALASPQFMQTIVPNINKLLEAERKNPNSAIIFLKDYHEENDTEFKLFPPHCIIGTQEGKIIEELNFQWRRNLETDYCKNRFSPFDNSSPLCNDFFSLYSMLDSSAYEVIIVGVCTDICVHYTAAGFISRDYSVIIPADCVDTYDASGHQAARVNEFFLKSHFPNILGIKVVDKVEEIL